MLPARSPSHWTAPWLWVATVHAEAFAQLGQVPVGVPTCAGNVSAEAQVTPVQVNDHVEDGVRVAIHYDAGIYDGPCSLTVTAAWRTLYRRFRKQRHHRGIDDPRALRIIGYANTTFDTGDGTVVITLSSHPGDELGSRLRFGRGVGVGSSR